MRSLAGCITTMCGFEFSVHTGTNMPYALITALVFALVAIMHGWRIFWLRLGVEVSDG